MLGRIQIVRHLTPVGKHSPDSGLDKVIPVLTIVRFASLADFGHFFKPLELHFEPTDLLVEFHCSGVPLASPTAPVHRSRDAGWRIPWWDLVRLSCRYYQKKHNLNC